MVYIQLASKSSSLAFTAVCTTKHCKVNPLIFITSSHTRDKSYDEGFDLKEKANCSRIEYEIEFSILILLKLTSVINI